MIFTNIVPWVTVLYLWRDNGEISEKYVSRFIGADLEGLCKDNGYILKRIKMINMNGKHFVDDWLMKFYVESSKKAVIIHDYDDGDLNLNLCGSDRQPLLYKLEIEHFLKSRLKRSGNKKDYLKNTLNQMLPINVFDQKYTDENGLEITVKVPMGLLTPSSLSEKLVEIKKDKVLLLEYYNTTSSK